MKEFVNNIRVLVIKNMQKLNKFQSFNSSMTFFFNVKNYKIGANFLKVWSMISEPPKNFCFYKVL